jgi:heterogeneous nuclear rnp K-like protein
MSTEAESAPPQASSADASEVTQGLGRLNIDGSGEDAPQRTEEEYAQENLTMRAIVSSKEAGVIIGKEGRNVADLREQTQVRAGVSKVVQGVHDRVLTITGPLDNVTRAYGKVAQSLLDGAPQMGMGGLINTNGTHRKLTLYHPGLCPRYRNH